MKKIKWNIETTQYYNTRMFQVLLLILLKKPQALKIHNEILKEIEEFQGKEDFVEKINQAIDKTSKL